MIRSAEMVTRRSTSILSHKENEQARDVAELIELARAGDHKAFGSLYQLYHAPVFRLARMSLGGDAEDAVAEIFFRAWKGLARYRDTGAPFKAWLYAIARRVVADKLWARHRLELRYDLRDRPVYDRADDASTSRRRLLGSPVNSASSSK
jgi:DNA-directed RNA polymerase specialized sigma24 family protein